MGLYTILIRLTKIRSIIVRLLLKYERRGPKPSARQYFVPQNEKVCNTSHYGFRPSFLFHYHSVSFMDLLNFDMKSSALSLSPKTRFNLSDCSSIRVMRNLSAVSKVENSMMSFMLTAQVSIVIISIPSK